MGQLGSAVNLGHVEAGKAAAQSARRLRATPARMRAMQAGRERRSHCVSRRGGRSSCRINDEIQRDTNGEWLSKTEG